MQCVQREPDLMTVLQPKHFKLFVTNLDKAEFFWELPAFTVRVCAPLNSCDFAFASSPMIGPKMRSRGCVSWFSM